MLLQRLKFKISNSRMYMKKRILLCILVLLLVNESRCLVDRTYFNYLGLKISANSQQIEKAYQEKLAKLQALENIEQKNRKMTLLESAYKTLINQKQRQKYERYGKDTFKTINQITSINQYTKTDSRKGPNMNLKIPVTIEDLYNGTTVKAQYQTREACGKCMGTGAESPKHLKACGACNGKGFSLINGMNKFGQPQTFQGICPQCQGSGKHVSKVCDACGGKKLLDVLKTIQIKIPAKYQDKQLRLKNYGQEQELGAPSDFLVQIEQVPSNIWKRIGQNLFYTMQISFEESIFGFRKIIRHLSGEEIVIQRKQMTAKQNKLNFAGKGFSEKGKLTVEFKINIPRFTDEQLDLWEQFFQNYNV